MAAAGDVRAKFNENGEDISLENEKREFNNPLLETISGIWFENMNRVYANKHYNILSVIDRKDALKDLRGFGIIPDVVCVRTENPCGREICEKIAAFSGISSDAVVNLPDIQSVYDVPFNVLKSGVLQILNGLGIVVKNSNTNLVKLITDEVKSEDDLK